MSITVIETEIEKVKDLQLFFKHYVAEARGLVYGSDPETEYISQLLAGLTGMDVKSLKENAYFLTLSQVRNDIPLEARAEIGKQIGDGVLGIYGFFPEIENYRHEKRDSEFFKHIGRNAYAIAADYSRNPLFEALARHFSLHLNTVRTVRRIIDKEASFEKRINDIIKIHCEHHTQT